jgi:hypothetical protein
MALDGTLRQIFNQVLESDMQAQRAAATLTARDKTIEEQVARIATLEARVAELEEAQRIDNLIAGVHPR